MDARTWNIVQLGIGFMLLFAGFTTQSFVEQTALSSVAQDTSRVDEHAGYYSLSIIYALWTLGNLVASPIIAVIGAKWTMMIGSFTFVLFLASFMYVNTWLLYFTSAIIGFGMALLWTGQGNYLSLSSDERTAGKNSGIVWALYQTCLIIGAIFLYVIFQLTDKHIDQSTIRKLYSVFTGVSLLGLLTFVFLRHPTKAANNLPRRPHTENILATFRMIATKNMIILSVAFMYAGMELTFWSGIYPTALAFTNNFNTSDNSLLAYNAFAVGLGQIVGGTLFGVYGERTIQYGRYPITLVGSVTHLISFVLIFINIPTQSSLRKTDEISVIAPGPSVSLALVCSTLLGFGDSCWSTQIFSILATMYKSQSSEAFAVFNFYLSLSASAAFFYGSKIELRWQLMILVIFVFFASACFYFVERLSKRTEKTPNDISSITPKMTKEKETKV